jgi:hypothetical protein
MGGMADQSEQLGSVQSSTEARDGMTDPERTQDNQAKKERWDRVEQRRGAAVAVLPSMIDGATLDSGLSPGMLAFQL